VSERRTGGSARPHQSRALNRSVVDDVGAEVAGLLQELESPVVSWERLETTWEASLAREASS